MTSEGLKGSVRGVSRKLPLLVSDLFNIILHLRQSLPSGLFLSHFPATLLYVIFTSSMNASCPTHLIFLDSFALMMFGDYCRYWKSSIIVRFLPGSCCVTFDVYTCRRRNLIRIDSFILCIRLDSVACIMQRGLEK